MVDVGMNSLMEVGETVGETVIDGGLLVIGNETSRGVGVIMEEETLLAVNGKNC